MELQYCNPFPNGSATKYKVREKSQFFDFNWLLWQRPLKNQKKLNEVNKPLHSFTNPEILVKIAPLAAELQVLESRPLKISFKNTEKLSAKYMAMAACQVARCRAAPPPRYHSPSLASVNGCCMALTVTLALKSHSSSLFTE